MTEEAGHAFGLQSHLLALINAGWTTQAIAVACELDLPDRLAAGVCSAQHLAARIVFSMALHLTGPPRSTGRLAVEAGRRAA